MERPEAESTIASAVIVDPTVLVELQTIVSPQDFHDQLLATIFEVGCQLHEAGHLDTKRLRSELRARNCLTTSADMRTYLAIAQQIYISQETILYAAGILRKLCDSEQMQAWLCMATQRLSAQDETEDVIGWLRANLDSLCAKQKALWRSVGEISNELYTDLKESLQNNQREAAVLTGFPSLDQLTGGFFPGQLWQIAARSYMGKSAIALALAAYQSSKGRKVYFASYEMEDTELVERLISSRSAVKLNKLVHRNISNLELTQLLPAIEDLQRECLLVDDRPPSSVGGLQARVRLASQGVPVTLVVVDHLLLFPHADRQIPRHQQLVEITRELKAMAKACNCTVLLLNQLNADAEGATPTNKHISESKGVLANLDVNILVHRETTRSAAMHWIVTKNRKGAPGELSMVFEGETQVVREGQACDMPNYDESFDEPDVNW